MMAGRKTIRLCKTSRRDRRGAAVVELAAFMPIILLLVLGAIDSSNALTAKQTIGSAAYEGARRAIRKGGTAADVHEFVNGFLDDAGIDGATVSLTPSEPAYLLEGQPVAVKVGVPSSNVALMPWSMLHGKTIEAEVVMSKE